MRFARSRRWFLTLTLVTTMSGLGAACGVKGPLYLPEEPATETDKEKKKDEQESSQREPAPSYAMQS